MPFATLASIGYPVMLSAMLDGLTPYVHLYTNDPALSDTLTGSEFVEVAYAGYQPLALKKYSPPIVLGADAISYFDGVQFEFTGGTEPLPVRGYYVTSPADGELLWAWRRPGEPFQFSEESPRLYVVVSVAFPGCP